MKLVMELRSGLGLLTPNPFVPFCHFRISSCSSFIPQTPMVAPSITHDFTMVRVVLVPRRGEEMTHA